jgi:hypothetical protein
MRSKRPSSQPRFFNFCCHSLALSVTRVALLESERVSVRRDRAFGSLRDLPALLVDFNRLTINYFYAAGFCARVVVPDLVIPAVGFQASGFAENRASFKSIFQVPSKALCAVTQVSADNVISSPSRSRLFIAIFLPPS